MTHFEIINMLDRLTIKAANSWLGFKRLRAKTYAMEGLYKNDKSLPNRPKILENTRGVYVKAIFND